MSGEKITNHMLISADPVALHKRIYALLIDTLVIVGIVFLGPVFGVSGKPFAFLLFFVLFVYDPLLVSLFGQTVGHRLLKIIVIGSDGSKPTIAKAYLRFVVKSFLGLFSFFSMMHKGLAIHDYVSKTKVVEAPLR